MNRARPPPSPRGEWTGERPPRGRGSRPSCPTRPGPPRRPSPAPAWGATAPRLPCVACALGRMPP
eukprot:5718849-Pyramimonas_sp.AAC.1